MTSAKKIKARKIKKVSDINQESDLLENKENRKIKPKKIRMSFSKAEEKKMDEAIARDDNVSIALIVLILAVCFVVGITLGYILYRIAITGVM